MNLKRTLTAALLAAARRLFERARDTLERNDKRLREELASLAGGDSR